MKTPPFLTDLLFAPGQHTHSIGLALVPTQAEMLTYLPLEDASQHTPVPEAGGGPPRAACYFDFEGKTKFGYVIFSEETLTPSLIVHELTHAAMFFVNTCVMTSAVVQAKSEEDQTNYYDEACAHTVELLCEQAFTLLFNWLRKSHVL